MQIDEILLLSHTVWRNEKFSLAEKKFRQINDYLVISLVKPLLSRNFCEYSVRENFCNLHYVSHSVEKREILCHKKTREIINLFSKTVDFTKVLSKKSVREFS